MEISFDVLGRPAPQGSKKSIGNNRFIETSKFLPAWRAEVKRAAQHAVEVNGWEPVSGPVELEVMFYLERPATVRRETPLPYCSPRHRQTIAGCRRLTHRGCLRR
jgi:hypothetical protein